ncbi:hypothetical protein FSP39_003668 [Pinctada imbricata]|uniref:Formyl transferase N-terminal domain-containing protein n=1 Tax=Pinctada imbricata TaxID=66713 RepID=A0AA88YAD1_PINIB|nr:hypothetical protein FSP39_003668 [Pinctada imbricata]
MLPLPHPTGARTLPLLQKLKVLLISDFSNTMTKRIQLELIKQKASVSAIETRHAQTMIDVTNTIRPDLIICPFLTSKVPREITDNKSRPCLIVHPGIAGDRGASSLDWAIHDSAEEWGVTILQADDKMDKGDIWCTANFPMKMSATKTGTYVGDVGDAAVQSINESLYRYLHQIAPVPLNYEHPEVKGKLRRSMKNKDRTVEWDMTSDQCWRMVRMSDTQPGALGRPLQNICNDQTLFRFYDAHSEFGMSSLGIRNLLSKHKVGDIVGKRNGAILMKTGDENGVWIGRMKKEGPYSMKKSAVEALTLHTPVYLEEITCPADYDDIRLDIQNQVAYIHFNFYDGAMDKNQCSRLESVLQHVASRKDVKIVAMMGGQRFFSTGIHLNEIEVAVNKQTEAWENINKIDDVIASMFGMTDKVTVAVLQGNAGAGGVMMAASCDLVVTHPGVLLTPSYNAMGLFGSEYWTYFLPERVGESTAHKLVSDTSPLLATTAQELGLVDYVIGEGKRDFQRRIPEFLNEILESDKIEKITKAKKGNRDQDWFDRVDLHRRYELSKMKQCFKSPAFLNAMKRFVYHLQDGEDLSLISDAHDENEIKLPSSSDLKGVHEVKSNIEIVYARNCFCKNFVLYLHTEATIVK